MADKHTGTIAPEQVELTRQLLQQLEEGHDDEASKLLDKLTRLREQSLYQELGKLTREFHEAIKSFRLDSRISSMAEKEIPDARDRLRYVIEMTQQSADRTMTAVEESVPLCEGMENEANALNEQWERFTNREMEADEFRMLSKRIASFLAETSSNTSGLRTRLNDVLLAQDFQDLTGQIIQRVITLVDDLEGSLVDLIRISGQSYAAPMEEVASEEEDKIAASGPAVPGVDAETVASQDDVDDLLSSLGF